MPDEDDAAPPPPVDPARDHVRGDGPRTLLLYGDYQDPHSRDAYRTVQALEAGRTPLRLAFRHLPVTETHPHALQAAVAAEAAHDQGRFWDMHDMLFTGQEQLGRDNLRQYAKALGLDLDRFNAEFASDEQLGRITADVRGALEAGVRGTPALFVDGVPLRSFELDDVLAALSR
jgi:NhaA family Na+:H+ antiporter